MRPARGRLRKAVADASLRVRVMAAAAILVALTSLVTGFLGTALLHSYLQDRTDAQLRDFAAVATRVLERSHVPARPAGPGQALPAQFLVEVVSADGTVQRAETPPGAAGAPRLSAAQLRDGRTPFTAAAAGAPAHSWRVLVKPLSGGRHAVIAFSLDNLTSTVTRLEIADALAGAIAIAVLAGVGLPLVRASLAPLGRIEATAAAIAGGDLSRRIHHPSRRTEVGRLADALNMMLGRIEAAYDARAAGEEQARRSEDRMRQFVADASHELRTPLTSVRGLAEFGLQQGGAASAAELLRLMSLIQNEAGRMSRLVEDLLVLARVDTGRPLERRPVDLASIAAQAVQAARIVSPGRPITLLAGADPVIVYADEERLRQVIDNLIGNAIQHTPPGPPVTVSVTSTTGTGEVIVADHGPGMTAEQAARVFERFYRTDEARARARGGTGLGLSIAAALVAAHDGDITVDTQPGQGAAFHVRLPLADGAESGPEQAVPGA
ncbi:MAG TPA: HAMP domain-containing sensor histidine kinase [Streptosporangiaceae bacterium]|nr:HAMP domain-containing sensor histidine kinase [Streptosporangiaceae bacterium]